MKTKMTAPVRDAHAGAAQGADEHVSERTEVRERARAGGNAAMCRVGVCAR